jgi:hypothetical protein
MGETWEEHLCNEVRESYGERDPVELQKRSEMTKFLLSTRNSHS